MMMIDRLNTLRADAVYCLDFCMFCVYSSPENMRYVRDEVLHFNNVVRRCVMHLGFRESRGLDWRNCVIWFGVNYSAQCVLRSIAVDDGSVK